MYAFKNYEMTKQAGFLKRLKNTIGKVVGKVIGGIGKVGNVVSKIASPAIKMIPLVGRPLSEVLDRVTNTTNKFGNTIFNISSGQDSRTQWKHFGDHIKDTYKSSPFISPIRFAQANSLINEARAQVQDAIGYFD